MRAVTEDRVGEQVSREQARRNANNDRRYQAGNRRAGLIPKADTVFRKLRSEKRRNPGSTALRAAMAEAGLAISDRDSRWLVKQMPLSYEGEPGPVWPLGEVAGLQSKYRQLGFDTVPAPAPANQNQRRQIRRDGRRPCDQRPGSPLAG